MRLFIARILVNPVDQALNHFTHKLTLTGLLRVCGWLPENKFIKFLQNLGLS